jgi:hypothetical protein
LDESLDLETARIKDAEGQKKQMAAGRLKEKAMRAHAVRQI